MCSASTNGSRSTIAPANEKMVHIVVADNGIGISPENLALIFAHGFTTRKNGHGFGLHSGALAAREMGGSLSAESLGLRRGATFTLELPVATTPIHEYVPPTATDRSTNRILGHRR